MCLKIKRQPGDYSNEEKIPVEPFFKSQIVFPAYTPFDSTKTISVRHTRGIRIDAFAVYPNGRTEHISQFDFYNITKLAKHPGLESDPGKIPRIQIKFTLNTQVPIYVLECKAVFNITRPIPPDHPNIYFPIPDDM